MANFRIEDGYSEQNRTFIAVDVKHGTGVLPVCLFCAKCDQHAIVACRLQIASNFVLVH